MLKVYFHCTTYFHTFIHFLHGSFSFHIQSQSCFWRSVSSTKQLPAMSWTAVTSPRFNWIIRRFSWVFFKRCSDMVSSMTWTLTPANQTIHWHFGEMTCLYDAFCACSCRRLPDEFFPLRSSATCFDAQFPTSVGLWPSESIQLPPPSYIYMHLYTFIYLYTMFHLTLAPDPSHLKGRLSQHPGSVSTRHDVPSAESSPPPIGKATSPHDRE